MTQKVFTSKRVHFSFWLQKDKIILLREVLAVNGHCGHRTMMEMETTLLHIEPQAQSPENK